MSRQRMPVDPPQRRPGSPPPEICVNLRLRQGHGDVPTAALVEKVTPVIERLGFVVSSASVNSLCIRGDAEAFRRAFGILPRRVSTEKLGRQSHLFEYLIPDGRKLNIPEEVRALFDQVSIVPPYEYAAADIVWPPPGRVDGQVEFLRLIEDVPRLLGADEQPPRCTGDRVRVVFVDSGLMSTHNYFVKRDLDCDVVLAGYATGPGRDDLGHGTAVAANIFAVAPGARVTGVKTTNEDEPNIGAVLPEAFKVAMGVFKVKVISLSILQNFVDADSKEQFGEIPASFSDLAKDVETAIKNGIVVVAAAGNSQYGFPAQMPDVISVGGVHATIAPDGTRTFEASNFASAFTSKIYPGRQVPDVCGLVGTVGNAGHIQLPVQSGSTYDVDCRRYDGTTENDGWAIFSGTSAAAPQVAGVCALLLEADPALTPAQIKDILCVTARDITQGASVQQLGRDGAPKDAAPQRDAATGFGLADASAAIDETLRRKAARIN